MLRISKLTDYGTVILACLAANPGRLFTAAEVAAHTKVGLPTVSKLLKKLQRTGLVASARGSHGGYQLAKPPSEITAARILAALEGGPLALTECSSGEHHGCQLAGNCRVGHSWQRVNAAIQRALNDITLAQLSGLERISASTFPLTRIGRSTHE